MDCPRCTAPLLTAERRGILVDHCPRCRGVWLDRGELDKLIERSAYANRGDDDSDWGDDRRRYRPPHTGYGPPGPYPGPPRKREGFFSRLFDFD